MSCSDRDRIGRVIVNGVLFTDSANVAVNGVGRNGRPNGTSGSNTYRAPTGPLRKCAAVSLASAGMVTFRSQLFDTPGWSSSAGQPAAAPKPAAEATRPTAA